MRPGHRNSTFAFGFRSSEKVDIYLHTKFRRDIAIYGWDITTSGFWKQTSAMLEFCFRFRFLGSHHHRHTILHRHTKLNKPDHPRRSYDVISIFSRWRSGHRNSTFGFGFHDFAHLRRSKSTGIPNFGEISQSAAEILLLPVSGKNVRHVRILLPVPIFTYASPLAKFQRHHPQRGRQLQVG